VVKTLLLLAVLTALAPTTACTQASRTATRTVPKVLRVRAYLFENKTAKWSDDVLDPMYAGLINTVAGSDASNATLVVVQLSGEPGGTYTGHFGPDTKYVVRLVAREAERSAPLIDQSQVIPVLNAEGQVTVAFLLHQDGCKSIRLSATVVGIETSKPVEQSLNFICRE
jgi:hypothetical protein